MLEALQRDSEGQLACGSPLGRPDGFPWTIFPLLVATMASWLVLVLVLVLKLALALRSQFR